MRALLIFLFSLLLLGATAQTWRSVDIRTMNPFMWAYQSGGGSENNRYFRINPYNNDIWLTYADAIQQLTGDDGQYLYYTNSNTPVFPSNLASFRDFAFTTQYTFALSGNYGLYQLNNSVWNLAIPFDEGINLAYDADTVWCVRTNENYMKWYGEFNTMGTHSASRRAEIKNGLFWVSSENSGLYRYENENPVYYLPDTTKQMDWGCWDMKFYPGTDSLFVANDGGFAIADGITFVDSICSANCTNMPTGKILEFEFDSNKNIWALIGNAGLYEKTGLAHYDVINKVWDQYYDTSNSPIYFGASQISIETDNLGNLWVIDKYFLHVLDEGNAPDWVGLKEIPAAFVLNVYPNPSNEMINLVFEGNNAVLTIRDAQGKEISTSDVISGENISLNELPAGLYLFEVVTEKGSAVKRVVKN